MLGDFSSSASWVHFSYTEKLNIKKKTSPDVEIQVILKYFLWEQISWKCDLVAVVKVCCEFPSQHCSNYCGLLLTAHAWLWSTVSLRILLTKFRSTFCSCRGDGRWLFETLSSGKLLLAFSLGQHWNHPVQWRKWINRNELMWSGFFSFFLEEHSIYKWEANLRFASAAFRILTMQFSHDSISLECRLALLIRCPSLPHSACNADRGVCMFPLPFYRQ